MIGDSSAAEGDWLVALSQTAGRGRQGRTWEGLAGNFFGSSLVVVRDSDPPAQTLSLVAGLALAEALDASVHDLPLMLKWPNDLLLGGAKLAGILLERQGDRIVAGFGLNLESAPSLDTRPAAHLGGALTPQAFAPLLASTFARMLKLWREAPPVLFAQAWMARAHPIGTRLKVHGEDGAVIAGTFDGIDDDGSLRLRLAGGELRRVQAGDVSLG